MGIAKGRWRPLMLEAGEQEALLRILSRYAGSITAGPVMVLVGDPFDSRIITDGPGNGS